MTWAQKLTEILPPNKGIFLHVTIVFNLQEWNKKIIGSVTEHGIEKD